MHISMHAHAGGLWGDEWSLKGYALGAQVDILVLVPEQLQFYPQSAQYALPSRRAAHMVEAAYIMLPNTYGRQHYDLPAEAFSDRTLFLMYDGQAHYYAAYKKV